MLDTSNPKQSVIDSGYSESQIKRNFRLGVLNGLFFLFADTLLDPTLVLVSYVSHLTNNPVLLGLILPVRDGAWALPQLWLSGYLQSKPKKISFYQKVSIVRIITWGILVFSMVLFENPALKLGFFFAAFLVSSIASGFAGLPFLEVVSKTIPPNRRGELFAWRFGLGGFVGIGASIIVQRLIDPNGMLSFPYNYAILGFAFFFFASISLIIFSNICEKPDASVQPIRGLIPQAQQAIFILKSNINYRYYIISQFCLFLSGGAIPFFAVFVQQELGGSKQMIGVYLGIIMLTNLLSNIVFGHISRKCDNQSVLMIASIAGSIMVLLVLCLVLISKKREISQNFASLCLIPVFVLYGIRNSGIGISSNSLLLNICPTSQRSLVLGFTQSIFGVVLLLTGASGVIVGISGYLSLFSLAFILHLMAIYSSFHTKDIADITN